MGWFLFGLFVFGHMLRRGIRVFPYAKIEVHRVIRWRGEPVEGETPDSSRRIQPDHFDLHTDVGVSDSMGIITGRRLAVCMRFNTLLNHLQIQFHLNHTIFVPLVTICLYNLFYGWSSLILNLILFFIMDTGSIYIVLNLNWLLFIAQHTLRLAPILPGLLLIVAELAGWPLAEMHNYVI
jgi:hypothetical protein